MVTTNTVPCSRKKFCELFETEVTGFPVATGTAANALSLASCVRPWAAIYCHEEALPGARLIAPVQANLVFVAMPEAAVKSLATAGVRFARRGGNVIRLVIRFDGTGAELDQLIALARQALPLPEAISSRSGTPPCRPG